MKNIDKIIDIISQKKNIIYSYKKAQNELISILRELTQKEKREIKPKILKLMYTYRQEYYNGTENSNNFHLACAVGFVVLSQKEYAQYGGADERLILPWYCPPWYSDYYNSEQWMSIGYTLLLQYISKGYIKPTGNKIALELVKLKSSFSDFEPITLEKHIWTLFKYESEVHLTKRYPKFGKLEWGTKLIELANENKIQREKLLSESMLVTTRNFNKTATGFFFDIITALEPNEYELLSLQESLFLVLQSQHSKPINQTLKYLKGIHKEPSFDVEGFMEQVPLLLSWSVKAVVNATLGLIDVLIKAYPTHKEALALLATQALAQEDESLQTKTIKLIAKHKLLETQSIIDEIAIYTEGLYHSTKQLLPKLEEVTTAEATIEIIPPQHIREDNRIIYPESFEDMVFFFSQVFEGNNVYDFDLFLALLQKFKQNLSFENITQIEPTLQRASKYFKQTLNSEQINSQIILYMAISFIQNMIEVYQELGISKNIAQEIYDDMLLFSQEIQISNYHNAIELFNDDKIGGQVTQIHKYLLHHINLPKLATPTHTPCFLSLDILLDRLRTFDKSTINTFDYEMAISRVVCDLSKDEIEKKLNFIDDELTYIIRYLFVADTKLNVSYIQTPSLWLIAILRKGSIDDYTLYIKYLGIEIDKDISWTLEWEAYKKPFEYETWENGEKVKVQTTYPKLKLMRSTLIYKMPFDSILKHNKTKQYISVPLAKYDDKVFLYISPFVIHPLLESILISISDNYDGVDNIRSITNTLKSLIAIWYEQHSSNYLFIAYSMLFVDKTTRQLSSELWYKATTEGTMNHQLLGETLGKLEHNEYAPLKRFTDLVVSDMLNLSSLHNQGLHTLLSAMIAHMNDEPIKGVKKLLEIYLEVLSLTNLEIPQKTRTKLDVWGEVKSLKGVVKKVLG